MPNRWVKEGYNGSERIQAVCPAARDQWVRLVLIADDYGLFDARPAMVASKGMPLQPIASNCQQLLDELERADLIRRYQVGGKSYGYVCRWYERSRSKPKFPLPPEGLREKETPLPLASVCNCQQLQALHVHDHVHGHDHDHVHELPQGAAAQPPGCEVASRPRPKKAAQAGTTTARTWDAYSEAYVQRYKTEPLRNVKVNSKLKQFVEQVGEADAPLIAAFYVTLNRGYYVERQHPVGLLVTDAESLSTQWKSGRSITHTQARQADRTQALGNVFAPLIAEARQRKAQQEKEIKDDD